MEQDAQALELFERPQVLPQDVSISHDFLSPDAHVLHAQLKRLSLRRISEMLKKCRKMRDVSHILSALTLTL
jgi:hypothetical protein